MTDSDRERQSTLTTADMASAGRAPVDDPRTEDADDVAMPRDQQPEADTTLQEEPNTNLQNEAPAPLMSDDSAGAFRERWSEIQIDFVDDPRKAVENADALVAEVMQKLAEEFAREREGLEKQWSRGGEASTEDLRLALRRYRSFFGRLLTI